VTPARPPRRGLSLVEVMLALAIMLIALAAIGQLVGIGADAGEQARSHARGTRLAQAKMAEVEAGVVSVQEAATGTFDADPGWQWAVAPAPQGPPNLYAVTVTASRDIRGKKFEVALTQLVFDPKMMGTAAQAERPTQPDVDAAADPAAAGMGGLTP